MTEELKDIDKRVVTIGGRHFRIDPHGAKMCLRLAASTGYLINGPLRGIISNAQALMLWDRYDEGEKIGIGQIVESMDTHEICMAIEVMADYVLDQGENYITAMLDRTTLLENEDGTGRETPLGRDGDRDGWDDAFAGHFLDLFMLLYEVGSRNFMSSGGGLDETKSKATQALKKPASLLKPRNSSKPTRSRQKR